VPSPGSVAATASTPGKDKDGVATADKKPKSEDDPKGKEADWRKRIQGARDALQRAEVFAEALQSRINGLSADFTGARRSGTTRSGRERASEGARRARSREERDRPADEGDC
jgi:hypothetical protein